MKFRFSPKIVFLGILASFYGCGSHPTSYQPANYPYPVLDYTLPESDVALVVPQIKLEEFEIPSVMISQDFSSMDKNHIRVQDNKLFAQTDQIILNLAQINEDEFAFPLPGANVISPYGGRRKNHSGIDLKTKANDTIVAAFNGIVRMAKPYAAYGNVVVIRHYNGLETIYSHNSKNLVKPGDVVKAGQPIALTGRTGRATTEHLHFEVRINGQPFNPDYIISFKDRALKNNSLVFRNTDKGSVEISSIRPSASTAG